MKAKNILYIMSDQHRFDALSINGNPVCCTPNIDRIGKNGMNFTNCYTTAALCSPARGSVVTGLFPHRHGQLANTGNFNRVFDRQILDKTAYPKLLQKAGYRTGIAGKWHLPGEKDNALWGYDEWHSEWDYFRWLKEARGIDYERGRDAVQPIEWGGDAPFCGRSRLSAEDTIETWITDKVLEMIDRFSAEGKPFQINCHYFAPHFPYAVPAPFDSMYRPEEIEQPANFMEMFQNKPTVQQKELLRWNASHLTWKDWQKVIAAYYGYCTYMDGQIGRLLDALEEKGLAQDTMVVYTADHGDMLGSHRLFNKGMNMYEETHHIPFLACCPGFIPAGSSCGKFASLADVAPTLLAFAGAEIPEGLDGKSLLALLQGEEPEHWRQDIFCEFHGYEPALCTIRMVRDERWKYVYNPCSEDELYDLVSDPGELYNLAGLLGYKHILRRMKEKMVRWLRETDDSIAEEDSWKSSSYNLYISERER